MRALDAARRHPLPPYPAHPSYCTRRACIRNLLSRCPAAPLPPLTPFRLPRRNANWSWSQPIAFDIRQLLSEVAWSTLPKERQLVSASGRVILTPLNTSQTSVATPVRRADMEHDLHKNAPSTKPAPEWEMRRYSLYIAYNKQCRLRGAKRERGVRT